MILWVIGAGGLFGSAVVRAAQSQDWTIFEGSPIPWNNQDLAVGAIQSNAERLASTLKHGQSWAIAWAAGRATTVSTQTEVDRELSVFTRSVLAIRDHLQSRSSGAFLLASSAGGVYAGSVDPPFGSQTTPKPVGIYGHLKRQQEITAEEVLADSMKVTIARISNLYGPGQDLGKIQGLISRLALAAVTKHTLTMFVPLDTLRDYIHVDDAARLTLHWLTEATRECCIRVIATGRAVTLGYIIDQMKEIAHTQIPVAYGLHPSADAQSLDLRLIPDHGAGLPCTPAIPLPAGMKEVYLDVLTLHQQERGQRVFRPI